MIRTAAILSACLAAAAHAASPREVAAELAATVEAKFYDEAKASEIATGLRAEAERGVYDALTDPRDLAPALTAYLRPFDTHFNVEWVGDAAPEAEAPQAESPVPRLGIPEMMARHNRGFRKVEILPGNVALIEMRGFDMVMFDDPENAARRAADAALNAASGAAAVVFDLSESMGGAPSMVGYLASAFLQPGRDDVYNSFTSRQGVMSEKPDQPYAAPRPDVPLFIVVSGRTSSAAESFPYTLQAAGRAVIVGEQSSGAGNPGAVFPLKSGYTVFISLGRTENPITKSNWEKTGVTPDIAAPTAAAVGVAYRKALEQVSTSATDATDRLEAGWALEQLDAPSLVVVPSDYAGAYRNTSVAHENGALVYRRDRRPAAILTALEPDLFGFRDNPARRIRFLRDAGGKVSALEEYSINGDVLRLPRD